MTAHAAVPYTSATVTRLQNKVQFGDAAQKARRPAQSGDVIKAQTYLLTETDSRADAVHEGPDRHLPGHHAQLEGGRDVRVLRRR